MIDDRILTAAVGVAALTVIISGPFIHPLAAFQYVAVFFMCIGSLVGGWGHGYMKAKKSAGVDHD